MSKYIDTDYASLARTGFLLGVALFAVGVAGTLLSTTVFSSIPGWERSLIFYMEVLGILFGLCSPLVFGVVLPLLE